MQPKALQLSVVGVTIGAAVAGSIHVDGVCCGIARLTLAWLVASWLQSAVGCSTIGVQATTQGGVCAAARNDFAGSSHMQSLPLKRRFSCSLSLMSCSAFYACAAIRAALLRVCVVAVGCCWHSLQSGCVQTTSRSHQQHVLCVTCTSTCC